MCPGSVTASLGFGDAFCTSAWGSVSVCPCVVSEQNTELLLPWRTSERAVLGLGCWLSLMKSIHLILFQCAQVI